MQRFANKIAIVTGGGGGIGSAIAKRLASEGGTVVVTDSNLDGATLVANEIAAAKLVRYEQYNPQSQPIITWPAAYPVVRSYVDQLQRKSSLAAARITAINAALDASEKQTGAARKAALSKLATEVDKDVAGSSDSPRVKTLSAEIRRLASATK